MNTLTFVLAMIASLVFGVDLRFVEGAVFGWMFRIVSQHIYLEWINYQIRKLQEQQEKGPK